MFLFFFFKKGKKKVQEFVKASTKLLSDINPLRDLSRLILKCKICVRINNTFTYLSCRDGPHKNVEESNDSIFPVL